MKFRNQTLRKAVLERDNFMCQKCKLKDETGKLLEVHHINPIYNRGNEELINLITLCEDCHHFAPNSEKEFNKYIQEEITGTATILVQAMDKVRKEHPELMKS